MDDRRAHLTLCKGLFTRFKFVRNGGHAYARQAQ